MPCHCCESAPTPADTSKRRRVLIFALAVNAAMFVVEIVAGEAAGSAALQADAIDFLGDSANYAISLWVAGAVLSIRSRAALFKGWTLVVLGAGVLAAAVWRAAAGIPPEPATMGAVGSLALLANAVAAGALVGFRDDDSNMRSVWICSRNDVIGNLVVLAAAAGVFGTGTAWPDLVTAMVMAGLGLAGGRRIILHARAELREGADDLPHAGVS